MSIQKITAEEIREAGVSALPASPSAPSLYGGNALSAAELRAAFDRLPKLVAEKFNALVDALGLQDDDAETLASLVATGLADGHSLEQLFRDIENGNFASYLQTADGNTLEEKMMELYGLAQELNVRPGKITAWNGDVQSEVFNATEGNDRNTATGKGAHAQGYRNEATGDASHVGGHDSKDGGNATVFAHGAGLRAARAAQVVFGKYNEAESDAALVVGDGENDYARHNLFAVMANGTLEINGTPVTTVETHDADPASHADIRQAAENARLLAEGRTHAMVFDDFAALFDALADADGDYNTKAKAMAAFRVGDHVYLRDTAVPDLWISGFAEEPDFSPSGNDPFGTDEYEICAGYVHLSRLESGKIDLSGYCTKAEENAHLAAKADTSSVTAALAGKADNADVVKHTAQTLTEAQKAQARRNVNAAATDGEYEAMTVGNAEQLVATVGVTDKAPYNIRTSGGSADIGNRLNDKIVGGTIVWNQLIPQTAYPSTITTNGITFTNNGDGTITVNGTATADASFSSIAFTNVAGHVYLLCGCPQNGSANTYSFSYGGGYKEYGNGRTIPANATVASRYWNIQVYSGTTVENLVFRPQFFDLTQMFGSAIAEYLDSIDQATAGAGVAWFRALFPKLYYEHNAGELMSVCTNAHITRGFNAWDEEWELGTYSIETGQKGSGSVVINKNPISVLPNTQYHFQYPAGESNYIVVFEYDANMNYLGYKSLTITHRIYKLGENTRFINFRMTSSYGTTYNHDICINLSWSGYRNGEYEPYVEHRYPLSPVELRGIPKLDASNNLYFDGDTYEKDGKVTRKYGIVDLGTLNWFYSDGAFITTAPTIASAYLNVLCSKYRSVRYGPEFRNNDKVVCVGYYIVNGIQLKDSSYSDAEAFKAAMSGVYLVYKLATTTTETADPFADPQIVDDFGTEEYVDALATAETAPRDVAIPVGHETFYQANLRDKVQRLPGVPGESGDFFVRASEGACAMVPLSSVTRRIAALERATKTELPTADGNYVLRCTVQDGSPTFTWEAEQGG